MNLLTTTILAVLMLAPAHANLLHDAGTYWDWCWGVDVCEDMRIEMEGILSQLTQANRNAYDCMDLASKSGSADVYFECKEELDRAIDLRTRYDDLNEKMKRYNCT